jgi:CRISPR/Cas system-associated exonuclease Cas4 (RecB family)
MNRTIWTDPCPLVIARQQINSDRQLILTASPRSARALDSAQSRFKRQTLQHYAKNILKPHRLRIASVLTAQRSLQAAVQEILDPQDVLGTATKLAGPLAQLLRRGIDLEALAGSGIDRAARLAQVTIAYQKKLDELNLIDSAMILWKAVECKPTESTIFVYGYFAPEPDELAFINAIAASGSHLFLPQSESPILQRNQPAINWLTEQDWEINSQVNPSTHIGETIAEHFLQSFQPIERSPLVQSPIVHRYTNREAEIRSTLGQIKQLLHQKVNPQAIVLVARNEEQYGPMLRHIAQEYQVPIRLLYSVPLKTTRLGAWVHRLIEAIEQPYSLKPTMALLRHVLTTSPIAPQTWPKIRKQRPNSQVAWQDFGVDLGGIAWPSQDMRENWVERLKLALRQFGVRRRSARWARETVAFNQLNQGLVDLARPESEMMERSAFFEELRASLELLTVPAQPGRGGIELHGPGALTGGDYQHVFVLGMAEGILPKPITDDSVLDFYDRKQLKQTGFAFDDAMDASHKEAFTFYTMLQTVTQQITFSYPQLLDRSEALPSSYLQQLSLNAQFTQSQIIASEEERREIYLRQANASMDEDEVLNAAIQAQSIEQRRESKADFDEYDGIIGLPKDPAQHMFSASQFVTIGQCPFKWYVQKVLHVVDFDDTDEEASATIIGQLYHKTLEILLQQGHQEFESAQIENAFSQAEQQLNMTEILAWNAKRQEHLQILRRAIHTADFQPPNAEVVALEGKFQGTWQGLQVKGTVDRIDRSAAGSILIDYKSGKAIHGILQESSGKTTLDIQMEIYQQVAAPQLVTDSSVADAYYYSVRQVERIKPKKPEDDSEWSLFADRVKQHLRDGHYPVKPSGQDACKYCAYDLVCRKGSRLSRKGGAS